MPLKELQVRYTDRRSKPFKLFDGGGLYLLVKPNGSKLWRLKYRLKGRENTLALGQYPAVSLAAARSKRNSAKVELDHGNDPSPNAADPLKSVGQTFTEIARLWHLNREAGLCPAHAQRVWRRMERDVLPVTRRGPADRAEQVENLSVDCSWRYRDCKGWSLDNCAGPKSARFCPFKANPSTLTASICSCNSDQQAAFSNRLPFCTFGRISKNWGYRWGYRFKRECVISYTYA